MSNSPALFAPSVQSNSFSLIPLFGLFIGGALGAIRFESTTIPEGLSYWEGIGMMLGQTFGAGIVPGAIGYCIGKRIVKKRLEQQEQRQVKGGVIRPIIYLLIVIVAAQSAWSATQSSSGNVTAQQSNQEESQLVDDDSMAALLAVVPGTRLRKHGQYQKAILSLTKAIQRYPSCSFAYCQRAFAYQQSGLDQYAEQAFQDADRAIKLDATNDLSFLIRGKAYFDRLDFENAVSDFKSSINLDPTSYSAYANLALVYAEQGRFSEAKKAMGKALTLGPTEDERAAMQEWHDQL